MDSGSYGLSTGSSMVQQTLPKTLQGDKRWPALRVSIVACLADAVRFYDLAHHIEESNVSAPEVDRAVLA